MQDKPRVRTVHRHDIAFLCFVLVMAVAMIDHWSAHSAFYSLVLILFAAAYLKTLWHRFTKSENTPTGEIG
jgi:hypothetical protein